MEETTYMSHVVTIRPATPSDLQRIVQLCQNVMAELVVKILGDQANYIIRHPWPYCVVIFCMGLVKFITGVSRVSFDGS